MEKDFYREYFRFENTHWWFRARERIIARLIGGNLRDGIQPRILDVGTGTGRVHEFLRRYGSVIGVEVSAEAIEFCRERGIRSVIQADAQQLPFQDTSFDLVSALDVIEHLDNDVLTVAELRRVLRRGGVLLATVPAFSFLWSAHDEINMHRRRYSAKQLFRLLSTAGLSVEKISYYNFFLFPFVAGVRLTRRILRRDAGAPESDLRVLPVALNRLLEEVFALERLLLPRWNLPIGVSIICLARKT